VFEILVESDKAQKKNINEINNEIKSHNDIWPDVNLEIRDYRYDCRIKEDVPSKQDIRVIQ
jgi:hypothetical protein